MELVLILLLLSLKDGNTDWKQQLSSALDFYRENRQLIAMLAGNMSSARQTSAEEPPQESPQKENRQQTAADSLNILENYLNAHAL